MPSRRRCPAPFAVLAVLASAAQSPAQEPAADPAPGKVLDIQGRVLDLRGRVLDIVGASRGFKGTLKNSGRR
jgi:hypothetical protein